MKICELPSSQLTVMKIIWDIGRPVQLSDVYAAVREQYGDMWQYQTVSTYIRWLVKKGFLNIEQAGRVYDYTPAVSEQEYLEFVAKRMTRFWGKKTLKTVACALRDDEELTDADIHELEELLHGDDE
ncbi:MAG TPA: BlaI/MecI/CopY family transcriptional regulator [Firmicutes bacterium]|nr:BlaI/MecI/CopY family transcriptional regulator [Bacillota bacterium]